jgi:hypothetical protein
MDLMLRKMVSSVASLASSCTSSGFDLVLNMSGSWSIACGVAASSRSPARGAAPLSRDELALQRHAGAHAPSPMRSWMTIETQKMISSMHGLLIVESMYNDDVELYLGAGATGAVRSMGSSSASASNCERAACAWVARARV